MLSKKQKLTAFWILTLGLALGCRGLARAADLYVSPAGTPTGSGSETRPCDLQTALSGLVARAGDTIWLGGGTYLLGHVDTEIHGASDHPITIRGQPGKRAQVVGSLTLWGNAGHVIFRDFELCSGVTNRVSKRKDAGFNPNDLAGFVEGIQVYAPNCSFINLVVHDSVRSGFYTSTGATNTFVYGCLVYNTGWASPDNAEGHSYYLQGSGEVVENIGCNSAGAGFHVYANGKGESLRDLVLERNVAFGAGALQGVRPYRDWLVGVDSPAVTADRIVLRHNLGYCVPNATTLPQVQLGREQVNGLLLLSSNYWPQGLVLKNWKCAKIAGNVLAPQNSESAVELDHPIQPIAAQWDQNAYCSMSANTFHVGPKSCSFKEWQRATGYDSSGSWVSGPLKGTRVFVLPNRYERGRANIVVYNWDNLPQVSVDLVHVLPLGLCYEVRNAQDFFGTPVRRGVFDGRPLELPMIGLTVAPPAGGLKTPRPTGSRFNVFIVLPDKSSDARLASWQPPDQRQPTHDEKQR